MPPLAMVLAQPFESSWFWQDRDIVLLEVVLALTLLGRAWLPCVQGAVRNQPVELSGGWTDGTRQRPSTLVAFANTAAWLILASIVLLVSVRAFW